MRILTLGLIMIAAISGVFVGIARSRRPHFTAHKIEYKITAYDEQGREADVSYLTRTRTDDGNWSNHQVLSDGTVRDMSGQAPYSVEQIQGAVSTETIANYRVSRSVIDKGDSGRAEVYFSPELGENLKTVVRQANGNLINTSEAIRVELGS